MSSSPCRWGVEANLQQLFAGVASNIAITPRTFNFRYRSATHFIDVFREWYGPVDRLERSNRAGPGSLVVPSEYLEIVVTRL